MYASRDHRVESRVVGSHRIDLEFPDVVHIHYGGDVEPAHYLAFQEFITDLLPETPLYFLRDARKGGFVAAETRKHIVANANESKFIAVITYGSSFQTKTVFDNMNRALRTIRGTTVPIEFFDTEAEARAWIDQHREARTRT
jgi:hypothetical protein